jgi:hypothetical protein
MPRTELPTSPASVPLEGLASVDADHHLWRNGRLWWIAFTVHLPGWRKDRVRFSLHTDDIDEARHRRDEVLREYAVAHDCALSLRVGPRRPRRSQATSVIAA